MFYSLYYILFIVEKLKNTLYHISIPSLFLSGTFNDKMSQYHQVIYY